MEVSKGKVFTSYVGINRGSKNCLILRVAARIGRWLCGRR